MWPKQDFLSRRRDRSLSAERVSLLGCIAFSDRDRDREGGEGDGRERGLCHRDGKLLDAVKNGVKTKTQNLQIISKFSK